MSFLNKKKYSYSNDSNSYMSQFVPRGEKDINVPLNSLIDIFTILLIFLLKSYTTATFAIPLTPGIKIPKASFSSQPERSVIVSVTNDYIAVDGSRAVFIKDLKKNNYLIEDLNRALQNSKANTYETKKLDKAIGFTGKIIIEADKNISFALLQKILFTSGQAGFDKVNLAVIKNK